MKNITVSLSTAYRAPIIGTMQTLTGAFGLLALLTTGSAFADADIARKNFFANLARAGLSVGVDSKEATAAETPVTGIYALTDKQGKFISYTNEAGTMVGSGQGFSVLSPTGAKPRPMNPNEKGELRNEVMKNIRYDQLIRVQHGDGGGRKLLMFSAVDCPSCKGFEDVLLKVGKVTGTTIYVVPLALQAGSRGGLEMWQTAVRLRCAADPGKAWQTYWQTRAVPGPRPCSFTPQSAELAQNQLEDIFVAAGVPIRGTPTLLREDGLSLPVRLNMDNGYALATFGPIGLPRGLSEQVRWLSPASAQTLNGQAETQSTAPAQSATAEPGKIKGSDLLKKLFK